MLRTKRKTLWLCFLFVVLFSLGTSPPASADTAGPAFDSYSPANGAVLPGGWVTVNVRILDADGILGGSQQLLINGQAVPAVLNYDVKSVDPVTETIIYDFTHAVITYRKFYTDSINNVQLTVKDQAGNISTLNWTFEIATAPTISNLTPAHDTATTETTPVISATVTHSGGLAVDPASVVMTLDGVQVPAAYDPVTGLVSYTPANPLTVGRTYTVTVSAADANNHTSSKQWNFNVVYPDMPVPNTKADCLRCHTTQPQSHRMGNCAACHDVALRQIYAQQSSPPHFVAYSCSACHVTKSHEQGAIAGQPAWYPIDAKYSCEQCHTHNIDTIAPRHQSTTTGDCSQCHSMVLEREHYRPGRTDKLGNPIDCFTCHTSARAEVKQAIATNNTACEACHTAGHAASHTNPDYTGLAKDPDMDCALCHNNDIATEHTTRTNAAGVSYTCDTCHKSTRPEVTNAITAKNKNCEACHINPVTQQPQVHTGSGSPLHDTIYVLTKEMACEQCHANNIKTVHVGQPNKLANNTLMTCDTCHKSADPAVQAAIIAKDTKCDSCHTVRHANANHTFPAGYVQSNPNNLNCADCHQGASLKELHIDKVTKTGVTMTCDTCHGSAAPANVKTAVAGGQANCDACHTVHPNDGAAHTNAAYTSLAKDPDMDCALCHNSVISDEHAARKDTAGANYTCATCHNSARAEVKAAILNKNKNCEACHIDPVTSQPRVHTASGSPLHDTTYVVTKELACEQCHTGNIKTVHVGQPNKLANNALMTCDTCHKNANPTVQAAITAKDTKCDACHTARHTNVNHIFPAGYVQSNPNNLNCADCHQGASLTDLHVNKVTKAGVTMTCDTCHSSVAAAAVKTAIAGSQTNCDACHTGGIHTNVDQPHTTALSTTPVNCNDCHNKVVSQEHGQRKDAAGNPYNCGTCHSSTRSDVQSAITSGDPSCAKCHASIHPGTQYIPAHEARFKTQPDVSCSSCHNTNIVNLHSNYTLGCDACHQSVKPEVKTAIKNLDTDCGSCHINPVRHTAANLDSRHTSTFVTNPQLDCTQCHNSLLSAEHVGKPSKLNPGQNITCDSCHTSADPKVTGAISSHQTNCDACHTVHPDPASAHTNPTYTALAKDPDMDCAQCHNSVISDEHLARTDAAGVGYTCGTCHNSARAEVKAAITNKNKNCEACHIDPVTNQPRVHIASGSPLHDTTYMLDPEVNCQQCHANNVKAVHVGQINTATNTAMDCATCHKSTNPAVQTAVTGKDTNCTACHTYPPARHQPKHTTNIFTTDTTRPDSGTCVTCHKTTDLKALHVGKVNSVTSQAMTCDTCHTSADPKVVNAIANKATNSCEACHTLHAPKDATAVHNTADVFAAQPDTDCASCHDRNVKAEHIDKGRVVNGTAMTCDSCHSSTNPRVVNAISANNTRCDACHSLPPTKHNPNHTAVVFTSDTTRTDKSACSMCHVKALPDQHVNKVTAAGVTMTCNTCHSSTAPADVKAAITGKNDNCEACHTVHPVKAAVTQHDSVDVFAVNADVNCAGCHNRNIRTEHLDNPARTTATGQPITCDTCHGSSNTSVQAAITAKDNKCTACHTYPPAKHQPRHATNVFTTDSTRPDAGACVTCHNTTSLTTLHVGKVNSVTNQAMTCDTCHTSADPKVVNAIVNKATNSCEACHTVHAPKDATVVHNTADVFAARTDTDCASCHDRNVKAEHIDKGRVVGGSAMTCDSCHGTSARQQVRDAIAANNTRCDACHTMPPAKHNPNHTAAVFTADATRTDKSTCTMCHVNILPDQHVNQVTSGGVTMDCNTCHSSTASATVKAAISARNGNCEACHTVHQPKAAVAQHDSTDVFATTADVTCTGCHQRNIRTEHLDNPARTTATGQLITCDACHGSTSPAVQAAISAKDTKCTACHTYPPAKHNPTHATNVYTTDTTRTDDCTMCHTTKDLKVLHVGVANSATGQAMTCDTCHAGSDPKVVNAIANKSTNSCEACHTIHPVKDVAQVHDSVNFTTRTYTDPNMNCSNCHNKIVSTEHVNKTTEAGVTMTCDTCHKSTRPDVQNAIATNNLKCEACHTKVHTSPDPSHTTTFVTNKTMACEKCHDANSIANDHTKYKTSTGAAITCDTCHKSADVKVINAIRTNNTGCDTCHTTRHTDVQSPHKTAYIPNTTYNCSSCHAAANIAYNMTASYHKIAGVTPTTNTLHGGTFVSPWTATSTLNCRDCHNKNTSTNTYYGKLLKGAYTATTGRQGYSTANQLCFFCHSTTAYGPGSSRSANSGFKGDGTTNWHSIGNHTEKGGCMACHTAKPHSGSKQGLIAIKSTTEPNSLITAFTHSTSYSKSNCTTSCH